VHRCPDSHAGQSTCDFSSFDGAFVLVHVDHHLFELDRRQTHAERVRRWLRGLPLSGMECRARLVHICGVCRPDSARLHRQLHSRISSCRSSETRPLFDSQRYVAHSSSISFRHGRALPIARTRRRKTSTNTAASLDI
jgi:hypothetical protein